MANVQEPVLRNQIFRDFFSNGNYTLFTNIVDVYFFLYVGHIGIGTCAIERLVFVTGAKKIYLDAKDTNAEIFWKNLGMEKIDAQTFCLLP